MKTHLLLLLCVLAGLGIAGCGSVGSESQRYAELRIAPDGRSQIQICSNVWRGVFTVHGYGGHARNVFYWATLKGDGPEYRDPAFHENSPSPGREHRGTILVDKKNQNGPMQAPLRTLSNIAQVSAGAHVAPPSGAGCL